MFRGTHLLFAMVLVFLLYRRVAADGRRRRCRHALDYVAAACCGARPILYLFVNYEYIINRIFYVDD